MSGYRRRRGLRIGYARYAEWFTGNRRWSAHTCPSAVYATAAEGETENRSGYCRAYPGGGGSSVHVASMTDADHLHHQPLVMDFVQNSVVTDAHSVDP